MDKAANISIESLIYTREPTTHFVESTTLRIKKLPSGKNMEKNAVKDSLRTSGTYWCGIEWRTDAIFKMGGYSGADR